MKLLLCQRKYANHTNGFMSLNNYKPIIVLVQCLIYYKIIFYCNHTMHLTQVQF